MEQKLFNSLSVTRGFARIQFAFHPHPDRGYRNTTHGCHLGSSVQSEPK